LRYLILLLALLFIALKGHAQNIVGSVLRLKTTTLSATCNVGDLRVDVSDSTLKLCGTTNNWTAIGNAAVTTGAFGSAPNADGGTIASNVLTLQPASALFPGGVTTGTQTFAGVKTFQGGIVGNVTGNVTGNLTGSVTGNADTATALSANPSPCSSNNFVTDIAANGALTCNQPTVSNLVALTASSVVITDGSGILSIAGTATYPSLTELSYLKGVTSSIQTQLSAVTSTSNPYKISNCSITASVSSNALTIALKDASGSDPSGGSPCTIAFRNATSATGTYSDVATSTATSVVVSNGSSLGCWLTAACPLYIYAINNAGTVVLGVISETELDEGSVQTSTAEGGAGGADTKGALYSTSAQSNKAVRLLGRMIVTPTGSFAWTNAPTEISNVPFDNTHFSTKWTSFTETGSWSSHTTYTGRYRRVGQNMEVQVRIDIAGGAPDSAALTVNLPSGSYYAIDTNALPTTTRWDNLGFVTIRDSDAASVYTGAVRYNDTTSVAIFTVTSSTDTRIAAVTQAVPMTFASGDHVDITFSVPIVGW
jgi:hypothetical protein